MTDSASTERPETEIIVTGRLSYADLFKPRAFKKGDDANARYKTLVLVPKDTAQGKLDFAAMQKASALAKKEKWGDKVPPIAAHMLCVKDGDTLGKEEMAGMWVLSASDDTPPQILDKDGQTELTERDGLVYSGSYARVMVNFWAQDNEYGKRINANLRAVQHVAKGDAFGKGRTDARAAFGSLADDDIAGLGFGSVEDGDEDAGQDVSGLI